MINDINIDINKGIIVQILQCTNANEGLIKCVCLDFLFMFDLHCQISNLVSLYTCKLTL